MILFAKFIYKCPECGKFYCKPNMVSTGKHADKLYSDGRLFAKMLPEHILITNCTQCKTIFWFDDESLHGVFGSDFQNMQELPEYEKATLISLEEFITVLQTGFYKNQKQELYVREYVRWLFNDRLRFQKKLFTSVAEKTVWTENLYGLIRIYESKSIAHLNAILKLNEEMNLKYGIENVVEGEHDKNIMKRYEKIFNISRNPGNDRFEKVFVFELEEKIADCMIDIAEIYRNLGNYETCHDILNNVETLDGLRFKEQMNREIEKKNDKVFRLR